MASDKEHLGHCILFAFQLNKNPAEATEMICSALGEGAMTHKTSKKWFQRFRNSDFDLHDRERSGQSKKFEDEELEQLLEENLTQTEKELANALGVTQQVISSQFYIKLLNRTKKTLN